MTDPTIIHAILQFSVRSGLDDKIKQHSQVLLDKMSYDMVIQKIPKDVGISFMTEFVQEATAQIFQKCSEHFQIQDIVQYSQSGTMPDCENKLATFNQFADEILSSKVEQTMSDYRKEIERRG